MKKAIIVGATSGIGKEVAILLLKEGWRIGIAGRRKEALENILALNQIKKCEAEIEKYTRRTSL